MDNLSSELEEDICQLTNLYYNMVESNLKSSRIPELLYHLLEIRRRVKVSLPPRLFSNPSMVDQPQKEKSTLTIPNTNNFLPLEEPWQKANPST
jgi:hypothetical protein